MRHLVVFSHPNPQSFNAQLCREYADELRQRGHEVVVRDLYEMTFDPILRAEDFIAIQNGTVLDEVAVEQQHVRWAEVITFISPIWWISWPAMLKGYVDRVFSLNFAYRYGPDGPEGCLQGKRALIFTSSGATMEHFLDSGKLQSIKTAQDLGTMEFCAIEMIDHIHFAPVSRLSPPEWIQALLVRGREVARKHF